MRVSLWEIEGEKLLFRTHPTPRPKKQPKKRGTCLYFLYDEKMSYYELVRELEREYLTEEDINILARLRGDWKWEAYQIGSNG